MTMDEDNKDLLVGARVREGKFDTSRALFWKGKGARLEKEKAEKAAETRGEVSIIETAIEEELGKVSRAYDYANEKENKDEIMRLEPRLDALQSELSALRQVLRVIGNKVSKEIAPGQENLSQEQIKEQDRRVREASVDDMLEAHGVAQSEVMDSELLNTDITDLQGFHSLKRRLVVYQGFKKISEG